MSPSTPRIALPAPARAASSTITEWGARHAEVVVAWHGLARTGRDMDDIAAHLAQRYRVICPDTHRPRPEPVEPRARRASTASLLRRSSPARCSTSSASSAATGSAPRWAARSACAPRPARCAGASAGWCSTTTGRAGRRRRSQRIRSYAGNPAAFATVSELEQYFRTDLQALRLAQRRAVAAPHRDLDAPPARRPRDAALRPGDGAAVHRPPDDYELWDAWDALDIPVLCLRGESSDLLLRETAERDAQPRPARGGGRDRRLRPRAGAEHARAVRAGRALLRRLTGPPTLERRPHDHTLDPVSLAAGLAGLACGAAQAGGTVGTTLPAGFPVIEDTSLGKPVIGFGAAGAGDAHAGDLPARQQRHAVSDRLQPVRPHAGVRAVLRRQRLRDQRAVGHRLRGRPVRPGRRPDAALEHRAHQRRQRARPAPLRRRGARLHRRAARSTSSRTAWA